MKGIWSEGQLTADSNWYLLKVIENGRDLVWGSWQQIPMLSYWILIENKGYDLRQLIADSNQFPIKL